ncbi:MAG: SusD/RagB family nutrient-binding outer membrane lipoprotein, partial [Alistipes sp.]|nr:SusD/RagB family nutrient-binding outer membrane lipoprotein [Alistipes sp.]
AVKNLPTQDFYFASRELNQVRWGNSGNGGIYYRALAEASNGSMLIPDLIMLRMNRGSIKYEVGTDDPRLPVIAAGFTPTGSATDVEYYGVSGNYMRNILVATDDPDRKGYSLAGEPVRKNIFPQDGQSRPTRNATRIINPSVVTPDEYVQGIAWSYYNPITYFLGEIPFPIETLAEVDLYLAEVALKNLASTGKSAGDHVQDAVLHSIDWWYMMNGSGPETYVTDRVPFGDLAKAILKPAKNESAATQFAGIIKAEFDAAAGEEDKMEIIMQQKYVHLNRNGAYELFAELRRTRHPKLEPISSFAQGVLNGAPALNNATMPFERYRYPTSEQTNNKEEFAKVAADDNWTTPIFWANKASESHFLSKALKD